MALLKAPKFGKVGKQPWHHSGDIARAVLAGFLGTALFIFVGVGSSISTGTSPETNGGTVMTDARMVALGIAYGLTLVAVVATFANISGGHFNPAVSAAFFVTGNMSFLKTTAYIIAQLVGSILGAAFLRAAMPTSLLGHGTARGGVTTLPHGVTQAQGWLMETIITFALVFVIFGTVVDKQKASPLAPIPVGFIVAGNMICAVRFTGAGMNPARSFGPSVVFGEWGQHGQHWLYWIGPLGGGIIAGLTYQLIFLPYPKKGEEEDEDITEKYGPSARTRTQAANQGVGQGVQNQPSHTAHKWERDVAVPASSGAV